MLVVDPRETPDAAPGPAVSSVPMSSTFRVLGPVEVWHDGRPGAGLSPRQRTLLAALLVDRGRLVPSARLVDRLWEEGPPPSASGTLQATISRLRRVIEPGEGPTGASAPGGAPPGGWTLRRRDPGYVLDVPAGDVDAGRFELLLAEARTLAAHKEWAAAQARLRDALGLWRGEPYEGVTAAFVEDERRRLERLRLGAHELRAEVALALGLDDEVVGWLEPLVEAEPWHEGLRAALIVALYRTGRQGEALGTYDRGRRILGEELGADPGPRLQEVLAQVLRHDPALLGPRASGAGAPGPEGAPSPTRIATGMPVRLTPFIGRDHEVAELTACLAAHRAVTVVGPGGCGKTRLAIETARRLGVDGAVTAFVGLAGLDADDAIATHLAAALGVTLASDDPVGVVAAALASRPMLLVVDNCEHVVEGAATVVHELLTRCPDLTVLATSRVPLDLEGEVVVPCGPLDVGGGDSEAARFFADRAGRAAPRLAAGGLDPALVQRICSELDGLPLAIELAAACLTSLSLEELAHRVDDRFTLLSSGRRGAPPHQRTLAATIQWSLDLLDADDLRLFEVASTFPVGFGLDALEAVAGDTHGDVVGGLRRLVASSLVALDHATGRYRMLETLRQFARSRLTDDEEQRLAARHASFLAALVDSVEPTLRRRDGRSGWRRLDLEHDNLRAVLRRLLARADTDPEAATLGLRIAGGLGWWCYRRGHVTEGRDWLRAALAAASTSAATAPASTGPGEPVSSPVTDSAALLRALLSDALLAYLSGDVAVVVERTTRMVDLAEGTDDAYLALALVLRAFARALAGDLRSPPEPERWLALADRSGVDWVRAEIAMTVGQFARAGGDRVAALEHLDRAERIAHEVGHSWAGLSSAWMRAKVLLDLDRPHEALASVSLMIAGAVEDDDLTGALAGFLTAVGALVGVGRAYDAAVLLGAVGALSRRVGYDPLAMDPVDGQRYVASVRGELEASDLDAALAAGGRLDLHAAFALVRGPVVAQEPGAFDPTGRPVPAPPPEDPDPSGVPASA
jgi:predicted ATPase/DNA-binding SARP family transcriptional activator